MASGVAPDVTQKPNTTLRVGRWFVLGGAFLVLLVFVTFRGRALLGWRRRNRRTSRLEESTAAAIHKNLADQAKSDVLAFGSAIEAERINEHDVLALWNLALDDYDQASRLFDDRRGPLDDRKIIEICARGMDRLAKAQR